MSLFRVTYISILMWLMSVQLSAQQINSQDVPVEWKIRIDTFDDFIERFNAEESFFKRITEGVTFTTDLISDKRVGVILTLCNTARPDTMPYLMEFAKYIQSNKYTIDPEGSNYASVSTILYTDAKGKEIPVKISFKLEDTSVGKAWFISDVTSDIFKYGTESEPGYIGISDNNLGFMGLKYRQNTDPKYLAGSNYKPDNRSLFFYMLSQKQLNYKFSEKADFCVTLGEYEFWVTFNDNKGQLRRGLLITSIYKNKEQIFTDK